MSSTPISSRERWMPVLEVADNRRAESILDAIATALSHYTLPDPHGANLANGATGVALFMAYLSKVTASAPYGQHALALLRRSIDESLLFDNSSFFHGYTGVAWTVEHLRNHSMDCVADPCSVVDSRLLEQARRRRPWAGPYDLVNGLVGLGVYAIERLHRSSGAEMLTEIVEQLASLAVHTNEGVTWWTEPAALMPDERARHPRGYYNLGLAHGLPGVVALLGQACAARVDVPTARPLLDMAVRWLLAHRNPEPARSSFAMRIADGRPEPRDWARVAWCYGALGASAALYGAAVRVREATWQREALQIARESAAHPMNEAGVGDAGLCHGAAGNGHIFNRFYQVTGDPVFLDAARRWFGRALQFHVPGMGIGGFQAWTGRSRPGETRWFNTPGLLLGPAGIGLALLSAISGVEPEWDRMLLVDLPLDKSRTQAND